MIFQVFGKEQIGLKNEKPLSEQTLANSYLRQVQTMQDLRVMPAKFSIMAGQTQGFVTRGKGVAVAPSDAQKIAPAKTQFGIDFSGTTSLEQAQTQVKNTLAKMDDKSSYTVQVFGITKDESGKLVPSDIGNYDKGVLTITGKKSEIEAGLKEASTFKEKNPATGSTPIVRVMEDAVLSSIGSDFKPDKMRVLNGQMKDGEVGSYTVPEKFSSTGKAFTVPCIALSDTGNAYMNEKLGLDGKTLKYFTVKKGAKEIQISTDAVASDMSKGAQKKENAEADWQARMASISPVAKSLGIKFDVTVVTDKSERSELHNALVDMVQNGAQDKNGNAIGMVKFVNDYSKSSDSKIEYSKPIAAKDISAENKEISDINKIKASSASVSKDFSLVVNSDGTSTVYGDFKKNNVAKIEYSLVSTGEIVAPQQEKKNVHIVSDKSISTKEFWGNMDAATKTVSANFGITEKPMVFEFDGTNARSSTDFDNVPATIAKLAKQAENGEIGKNDVFVLFTDGANRKYDAAFKKNMQTLKDKGVTIGLALYKGGEKSTEESNGKLLSSIVNPGAKVEYVNLAQPESIVSGLSRAIQPISPEMCDYSASTVKYAKATITYEDGKTKEAYIPIKYADKPDLLKDAGALAMAPKKQEAGSAFWTVGGLMFFI